MDDMIEQGDFLLSNELIENNIQNFEDIEELKENLLRGIYKFGLENTSQTQGFIIKSMFNKKDLLVQSREGTGKTTAGLITALQVIDETVNKPQVLILNQYSEINLCSYNSIKNIGFYLPEDDFLLAMGGTNRKDNILKLGGVIGEEKNDHVAKIVFGTLGRISDLVNDYPNLFDSIKLLIVEDCDEIINGCLKECFHNILINLKKECQICMFTSTITEDTKRVANELLINLKLFQKKEIFSFNLVKHTYTITKNSLEFIKEILNKIPIQSYIIYANSRDKTKQIKEYLDKEVWGENIEINSHADKNKIYSINNGTNPPIRGIVVSNCILLNRINLRNINLIINFDIPKKNNIENYIHKIAINGYRHKKRLVINILENESDIEIFNSIDKMFKTSIKEFESEDFEYIN